MSTKLCHKSNFTLTLTNATLIIFRRITCAARSHPLLSPSGKLWSQEAIIIPVSGANPLFSYLADYAVEFDFSISQEEISRFDIYLRELKAWNEKFNLTAIKEDREIVIKHFLDSLTPLRLIKPGSILLDIGSGAGFPGIPLKIVEPSLNITLIDSVNKKVTFMKHIIEELGLSGIEAIHTRAEDLAKTRKGALTLSYHGLWQAFQILSK